MDNQILGMSSNQFNTLVLLLLLIILGVVSFQYYAFVSASNGLSFGSGVAVNVLGKREK